jgi:dTDP-glucose 4,6-dehydratase
LHAADVPEPRFDFVIHAATESGSNLGNENPLVMFDTIVQGTRAALQFATDTGAERFLLTSSGAVYGPQPFTMSHLGEDFLGGPDITLKTSAYGEGKRSAEILAVCFGEQRGIESVIARCFAFVGPFLPLNAHFAIGNFLRDALAGGTIQVGGDGTPLRSYLHAADLTIWLWSILLRGRAGRCYNVGSEDARSIREIAELVADVSGAPGVEVARPANPSKPGSRYVPSCRRARDELQLETWIDLPAAIKRTLAVLQMQQKLSATGPI